MSEKGPEQEATAESLTAPQVFDEVVNYFRSKEGARTILFNERTASVLNRGGWDTPQEVGVFQDCVVTATANPDVALVTTVGSSRGTYYRSELLAYMVPASMDDEAIAGHIRDQIERLPEADLLRWPHILLVSPDGILGTFPQSQGQKMAEAIAPNQYVTAKPQYSNRLLRSIWDPSPLVTKGSLYDPAIVNDFTAAIEQLAATPSSSE